MLPLCYSLLYEQNNSTEVKLSPCIVAESARQLIFESTVGTAVLTDRNRHRIGWVRARRTCQAGVINKWSPISYKKETDKRKHMVCNDVYARLCYWINDVSIRWSATETIIRHSWRSFKENDMIVYKTAITYRQDVDLIILDNNNLSVIGASDIDEVYGGHFFHEDHRPFGRVLFK